MSVQDPAQIAFTKLMAEIRAELGSHATLNQIEAAILARQESLLRSMMQQLQQEALPQEELSPLEPLWKRDGRGSGVVQTLWGSISTLVQRWRHAETGQTTTTLLDPDLDGSGWTQQALTRPIDMGSRLVFEEASETLSHFGLDISAAELARLLEQYGNDAE